MKIKLEGSGKEIKLSKNNFLSGGGEGSVYVKGTTAFKLYHKPQKALSSDKRRELQFITASNVIVPDKFLYSPKGELLGYTMRYIPQSFLLCRLFTRTFKETNGVTQKMTIALVKAIQQTIKKIHQAGITVVDLNEMNILVTPDMVSPYFIDVDSYQTPGHPATAIMESIRDRQSPSDVFNEQTDWFAFAIMAFQLFIGIHPYKGKHPSVRGLDARMKQNLFVLDPDVTIPKMCYPLDSIPTRLRQWMTDLLQDGQRKAPPDDFSQSLFQPTPRQLPNTKSLKITQLFALPDPIVSCTEHFGRFFMTTKNGVYTDDREFLRFSDLPSVVSDRLQQGNPCIYVGLTQQQRPVLALWHPQTAPDSASKLTLWDPDRSEEIPLSCVVDEIMQYQGRFYLRSEDRILELILYETGSGILATAKRAGNILKKATRLFSGLALQHLLGSIYVSLFPNSGVCHQMRIDELAAHQIIDARFERQVLMIVGVKRGIYDRFVIRFNPGFTRYDVRKTQDIVYSGLNFTVLHSGVCVHLTENEKLELFLNKEEPSLNGGQIKIIGDPVIGGDMQLLNYSGGLAFFKGKNLSRLSMTS